MYERNAIVLERYFEKKFGFDKPNNLKINYTNFGDLVEELEKYQITVIEEEKVIQEFEEIAKKIQIIQKAQEKLCATNEKLEEERNRLFNILDEEPSNLENKLEKIENTLERNNQELKELRIEFIEALSTFREQQIQRNRCAKERRIAETNHVTFLQKVTNLFQEINQKDIQNAKNFISADKEILEAEIYQILIKNGKSERVEFYKDAMQLASKTRMEIAVKEVECYLIIYDKLKKLLQEVENDNLKLAKYQKTLRDIEVKLAFLKTQKEYIVGFLDNERMIAINGVKAHKKMMEEACKNFEKDMIQISNLYELILREVAGKSTKKAYKELYNKTYLKEIEDKERNFEQEVNHIKISMGTVINSNYWRIEGIKNIYNVFQEEVSEKFEKDLSEFKIEEPEEILEPITIGAKNEIEDDIVIKDNPSKKNSKINPKDKYDDEEHWGDKDDNWDNEYEDEEKWDNEDDNWDDEYEDEEDWDNEDDNWDDKYEDEEEWDNEDDKLEDKYEDEEDWDDEDDDWDDEDENEEELDDIDEEDIEETDELEEYEFEDEDDWDDDFDDEEDWDDEEDNWNEDINEDDWNEGKNKRNDEEVKNTKREDKENSKGLFNKFFKKL